jgi:adenylate cyclase
LFFKKNLDPSILPILDAENSRNAKNFAAFRMIGSFIWLLLCILFGIVFKNPDWAVSIPYIFVYLLISILLFRSTNINSKLHPLLNWSSPLADIPIIYISLSESLKTAPYPQAGAMFSVALFILFILPSHNHISILPNLLSILESCIFSSLLLIQSGVAFPIWTSSVIILFLFVFFQSISISNRPLQIAKEFALEKTKFNNLQRYFSPSVTETILHKENSLNKNPFVTILVSDIRGFTSFSEKETPETVLNFLNIYLSQMVEIIFKNGGTLDKFMGDGILAYFGAPLEMIDHADRAIQCANEMLKEIDSLNLKYNWNFKMGIGIHSGRVLLGDIGPEQRKEFTIIGDTVNLCSRIESLTKEFSTSILVSESTKSICKNDLNWIKQPEVFVKGKLEKIQTYTIDF